ncbi:MAG: hypothetical protein MI892_27125 [Desulfobacterales bacterium]|nr:hypothetical protein [Desulfobacterales bacterium]
MKRLYFFISTLLCLFIIPCTSAKQQINWLTFGQIPAYISTGEFKNKGFIDQIIQMLQKEALKEFEFNYFQVNHKRFNIMALEKGNCYIGWKTFSDHRLFSKPIFIWYPSGIIIQKQNQSKFGPKGSILSLKKMLKNKALTLGVIDEFAYSPGIQSILTEYRDAPHVYFIKSSTMQVNLKMLVGKRVDYTIGWPSQPIVEEKLNGLKNDFMFYNVEEDQKYLYIGVSCSKCDQGERVINQVNTLFSNKEALLEVKSIIQQWVFMSEQHESLYQEIIFEGKNNPKVIHMKYP